MPGMLVKSTRPVGNGVIGVTGVMFFFGNNLPFSNEISIRVRALGTNLSRRSLWHGLHFPLFPGNKLPG